MRVVCSFRREVSATASGGSRERARRARRRSNHNSRCEHTHLFDPVGSAAAASTSAVGPKRRGRVIIPTVGRSGVAASRCVKFRYGGSRRKLSLINAMIRGERARRVRGEMTARGESEFSGARSRASAGVDQPESTGAEGGIRSASTGRTCTVPHIYSIL